MDRPPANSSAVERGEVPEVAALGNTLTGLFNTLGVSQRAYAVRITLDPSVVSRYLRGQRVATEDFVDRLVREAERKLGSSLQEEVKARLHDLRLAALRATDPAAYELESLRREMERSQRAVERLTRQQEALHDLLEKREAEAAGVRAELSQLQRDWADDAIAASRRELDLCAATKAHTTARDDLLAEIARLRGELADTAALKSEAEARCRGLEGQVLAMEEELAGLRGATEDPDPVTSLPVAGLLERLQRSRDAGDVRVLGLELAEAGWTRSAEEISEVMEWLHRAGEKSRADSLLRDVVQARPLDVVRVVGDGIMASKGVRRLWPATDHYLLECVARFRTVPELAALHVRWEAGRRGRGTVLGRAVMDSRPAEDVLALLEILHREGVEVESALTEGARAGVHASKLVPLIARLPHLGHRRISDEMLVRLMQQVGRTGLGSSFGAAVAGLAEPHRAELMDRMTKQEPPLLLETLIALYRSTVTEAVGEELVERARSAGLGPALTADMLDTDFLLPSRLEEALHSAM
ncbi:hypothetical protein [Streptomyces sp. NPDC093225]|uniref:hypothetical protein n=1 Tax=Streptomyces sp. NPDC093225 TaxID=3366034 RepID=UPI00381C49C1